MLRRCLLPKCEVVRSSLVLLAVKVACSFLHFVEGASRKDSVFVVLVILQYIEVDGSVALICVSGLNNLLHEVDLFNDVS